MSTMNVDTLPVFPVKQDNLFAKLPAESVALVQRCTFGMTLQELALVRDLGYWGYLEYHLNHAAIDDSSLDAALAPYTTLTMAPYQLATQTPSIPPTELIRARILRAFMSRRQLFERMVEFWTNHFNIYITDSLQSFGKTVDDRDVIRANALTNFPTLLRASAHSPAMLDYLNNNTNTASAPNENYARELMELHSLSVNGGYTQTDVQQVAKCFTGWNYYGAASGTQSFTFRYLAGTHDNTQKIVLGNIIPAGGGQQDGETVLTILANHPSTANFIATKLLKWMWGYSPSAGMVSGLAAEYTRTGGDIRSMLRWIFNTAINPIATPKFKQPLHLLVSGLRALGAAFANSYSSPGSLQNAITQSGNLPFNWQPPDGYPDTLEAWVGLELPRWNFGASLMNSEYAGVSVNLNTIKAGATTAAGIANRIELLLFGGAMPATDKASVRTYMLPDPPTDARVKEAIGLAFASPGFQWY